MVIDMLAMESLMEQMFLFWCLGLLSNDLICLRPSSIPRTQSSVPKYLILLEVKKYIKLLVRIFTQNLPNILKMNLSYLSLLSHDGIIRSFFIAVRALLKILVCPSEFDPDN